ncbi:hypothetical protein DFJ74DRAFT_658679 [Hyaloraphidium curvatum]|nr:hypothetical protein DFJ74DRAFT_658679 [Hyaloraphidium curvatum]
MAPGAARSFLERALRDYRIMNNLSSFAASSFEIDIAFMVDCTSSMGTYLGFVHQAIRDLLGHLRAEYPHVAVRMAFVGYTDFDDRGVPTYFVRDFGTPEEVGGFLEGVACRGGYGSDFAEDVLGGLREATKLSWRNQVRVLVHVGDAPPHGRRFRDSGEANDRWYHDHIPDPNGIAPPMYRDLLSQLMSVQRVRTYLFLSLDRYTRNTEALFAEHVKGIPEAEFHVVPFAAQQGVRPDYGQFLGAVLRGAGQSIYQSVRMDTMVAPPDA